MKRLGILLLAFACTDARRALDVRASAARPDRRAAAAALNRQLNDGGLALPFTTTHDSIVVVDSVPISMNDGPCGNIATRRVRRIAVHDTAAAIPEVAIEVSKDGKVLRQWAYPLNQTPIGIAGDELVTSVGDSAVLAIQPNGAFRILPKFDVPDAESFKCPEIAAMDSPYQQCYQFEDIATHTKRRIAYLGECS